MSNWLREQKCHVPCPSSEIVDATSQAAARGAFCAHNVFLQSAFRPGTA